MDSVAGRRYLKAVALFLLGGKKPWIPCDGNDQNSSVTQMNMHGVSLKLERKNGRKLDLLSEGSVHSIWPQSFVFSL